jgi:hypothetical protein
MSRDMADLLFDVLRKQTASLEALTSPLQTARRRNIGDSRGIRAGNVLRQFHDLDNSVRTARTRSHNEPPTRSRALVG